MQLVTPNKQYRDSYLGYVAEFTQRAEPLIPFPLSFPTTDFQAFLARLMDDSRAVGLTAGFVANSTYWLIDDRKEVVAVSNLRHELTKALRQEGGHIGYSVRPSRRREGFGKAVLQLTLARAKERNILKALVTCDSQNTGSIEVILKNGGIFAEDEVLATGKHLQRYWISL